MRLIGHYTKKTKTMYHIMLRCDAGDYVVDRKYFDVSSATCLIQNRPFETENIFEITPENREVVFGNSSAFYMSRIASLAIARPHDYRIFIVKNPIFEADIHILRKGKISSEIFIDTAFGPKSCPMADNHDIRLVMESMLNRQYRVVNEGIIISGRFIYNAGYSVQRE